MADNLWRTFALFHRHWHYLGVESTGFSRGCSFLLRPGGKSVLLLTRNAVLPGDVFCSDPHVVIVERIPKPVGNHAVLQARMTKTQS